MTFKGAIFDLDGVIVDTVPFHFAAWKHLFHDDYGIPFTEKTYQEKVDGKPRLDSIRLLLPQLSEEEIVKAGDVKQGYFLELLQSNEIKYFPEAITLVKDLQKHQIQLAIASSSKNAELILKKIGIYQDFQAVISGYDFVHGKPHPEIFLTAAKALKLDPSECVVFEDAIVGIQAAKAGNFLCVGIDMHDTPENYKQADLHVKNLQNVNYQVLTKLFS
jgi:beta-phosphoglucomutase